MPHIHKRTRLNTHWVTVGHTNTECDALRRGREGDNSEAAALGVQHTDEFTTCTTFDSGTCQRGPCFWKRNDVEGEGFFACLIACNTFKCGPLRGRKWIHCSICHLKHRVC